MSVGKPVLKAPFPYFGGKSRVALIVWDRFGDVSNYIEPFCGSSAMLLARPHYPFKNGGRVETINDLDCFISNFWRALRADPESVANHCDYPVIECDLHSRHLWLVNAGKQHIQQLKDDPDYYDAKIAGWWVWGISAWIGSGWCLGKSSWGKEFADGRLAHERIPCRTSSGQGVNRTPQQLPAIAGLKGTHKTSISSLVSYLTELSNRLRYVRVCCGDWQRICKPSVTESVGGIVGIFLDPPYSTDANRDENLYTEESNTVAHDVRAFCIANGDNPKFRICLCGYEGEHAIPDNWVKVEWKAVGGYGNQTDDGQARENAKKERLWFSPHCLDVDRKRGLW